MMLTVNLLIADDHHLFREALVNIIQNDPSYNILFQTGDGLEAFNKIKELTPDIAILDISMPTMNGLDIAKKLKRLKEIKTKIVLLTVHKNYEYFTDSIRSGVKGYLLKENTFSDLIVALRSISKGERYISPLLSSNIIEWRLKEEKKVSKKALTDAEKRLAQFVSQYKTNKEIADKLCLSIRTVENKRAKICEKLGLSGMNSLLKWSLKNKLKN